jgi:hypothetical protein
MQHNQATVGALRQSQDENIIPASITDRMLLEASAALSGNG